VWSTICCARVRFQEKKFLMGKQSHENQGGKSVSWGMGLITPLRLKGDDQDQSRVQWCMSGATPRKRLGYDQGPEPWTTTSCVLSRVGRRRAAYLPPTQTDCLLTPQGYHSLPGEGLKNHLPRQTACDHSLPRVDQSLQTSCPCHSLPSRG